MINTGVRLAKNMADDLYKNTSKKRCSRRFSFEKKLTIRKTILTKVVS